MEDNEDDGKTKHYYCHNISVVVDIVVIVKIDGIRLLLRGSLWWRCMESMEGGRC